MATRLKTYASNFYTTKKTIYKAKWPLQPNCYQYQSTIFAFSYVDENFFTK